MKYLKTLGTILLSSLVLTGSVLAYNYLVPEEEVGGFCAEKVMLGVGPRVLRESQGGTSLGTYTAGDILFASALNDLSALGIGADGEILTLASGLPSWAVNAGSGASYFADLLDVTTSTPATGDVYYLDSTGTVVNLGVGSNDDVLTLATGIPSWATLATGDVFAWTPETDGNATSTRIILNNGLLSTASSTFTDTTHLSDMDITGNSISTGNTIIKGTKNLDNYMSFFNGTFVESFNATSTSNGSIVTMIVADSATYTGGLTMRFSTGDVTLATPASIILTAGSDSSPTKNYTYIPISTKVLTVSTSDWPVEEHIKVDFSFLGSAALVQSDGEYINQNHNDEASNDSGEGHVTDLGEWVRRQPARYFSGVDGAGTSDYLTPTAGNVEFKSTSGLISQMHLHTFPAIDTSVSDAVFVKNWSGGAFHKLTNLYDITRDSTSSTIGNNKFFNLTFWGVANKTGQMNQIMVNLPSGSYNSQSGATNDTSGFNDDTMPREFDLDSSTGFLLARMTIKMKTGGGTWEIVKTVDCRQGECGSGGGIGVAQQTTFADNAFTIFDETTLFETTYQLSGLSANREITMPDAAGEMCLVGATQTLSNKDFSTDIDPDANNTIDLGAFDLAYQSLYVSSTAFLNQISVASLINNDAADLALGTACDTAGTTGNVCVGGSVFTVDNQAQFDGLVVVASSIRIDDNVAITFGGGNDVRLAWLTAQTPDSILFGLGSDSNGIIFTEEADLSASFDFAHPQQTNPTIFVQSANQSVNEYLSFAHDQTDGVIGVGTGNIVVSTTAFVGSANGSTNNATDLGQFGKAWKNVFVSSTLVVEDSLFGFDLASTSPRLISGGILDIPKNTWKARQLTQFRCHVDGGTSVVVNVSDGSNDTETITCLSTQTSDTAVTSNNTFTADELWEIQIGTITGAVDYLVFEGIGYLIP